MINIYDEIAQYINYIKILNSIWARIYDLLTNKSLETVLKGNNIRRSNKFPPIHAKTQLYKPNEKNNESRTIPIVFSSFEASFSLNRRRG